MTAWMRLACVFIFLLIFHASFAQTTPKLIRVGVLSGPPMSYQENDGQWHGVAVKLWEEVAQEYNWKYKFILMGEDTEAAISALQEKNIDVLIGPVSVTHSRLDKVDFSRPYFINKVVTIQKDSGANHFGALLLMIFSKIFNWLFIAVAIIFLVIAHLLWFFEKEYNRDFQQGYFSSIIHGMWSLLMLLVGNQLFDRPRHKLARFLVLMVIFLAVIFSSLISAAFTSSLTLSLSSTPGSGALSAKSIQGKTFLAVHGQATAPFIERFGGRIIFFKNLDAVMQNFQDNTSSNAVVGDLVLLEYAIARFPKVEKLQLTPTPIATDEYAFAFQRNSTLRANFDYALTALQDKDEVMPICLKFLSTEETQGCLI